MDGNSIWLTLSLLITFTTVPTTGTFVLTVKFINYTNPTGLCAECSGGLENVTSADQLTPVCCDESPVRSDNCDNTGEARCDTRFRWTLRPFGASLETRPDTVLMAANPPYHFTDCGRSPTTCPFSEMSTTFSQSQTGFLGVAANPLTVVSRPNTNFTFTSWPGQVQFFIEALDSGLPNIIDSLLINLGNLQLGADFTEEMTFTGYHNISHMTMSFRVACQTGFCGKDCTVRRQIESVANPRIFSCNTNGTIVCTDSRYNPSASCNECFHGLDISTHCSTCLEPNFDPDTNCTACLPGYEIQTHCSTCLNTNYDSSTNCTTCLLGPSYDPVTDCTTCLDFHFDPGNNCTSCLDSRFDPDDNCTSCLLEGRDPLTNCTQCLPNRDLSTNCTQCSPGWDISSDCMSCLPYRNPSTNCTQCLSNRDPSTDCSTCLFDFDISRNCSVCLPGRNISTNCTTCQSGYAGENCEQVTTTSPTISMTSPTLDMTSPTLSAPPSEEGVALIGGVAGGVGGALLLVIIVLVVIVLVLVCQVRRSGHIKLDQSDEAAANAYSQEGGGTGTGSSAEHKFHNPIYSPVGEPDLKTDAETTQDRMYTNSMYETSKLQGEEDYSQLRHPSTSPSAKTGASNSTPQPTGPVYDVAYQGNNLSKEGTPVYDTADHRGGSQPPFSTETTPQQESYAQLRKPTEMSVTLQPVPPTPLETYDTANFTDQIEQPVYDEANLPPPTASAPEKKTTHPSKSPGAYEEVLDEANTVGGTLSTGMLDSASPNPFIYDPTDNDYSEITEISTEPTNVYSAIEEPTGVYTAVEEPANVYSALEEPTNTHSALEGPTEDYSELDHPAKAVTKPEKPKPVSNYSRLNGHSAEDLPMYDVSSHDPPQTHPQTLPPHEATLYDTANFPNEPTPDYTETADFIGLPSDSSPSGSVRPHPYDYVETELNGGSVPPAVDPRVRPVYTNTMPGKITAEAESHYDLGL